MNHADLREKAMPLPSTDSGYRRVLILGTTGAGKTTVVRQLLGTHPKKERFPSTSTSKTTVADTEIIPVDEPCFRAAITFMSRDEVEDYLFDNIVVACRAILDGASYEDVYMKLLDHEGQRFRLSYLLGRPLVDADDDIIEEETEAEPAEDETNLPDVDVARSRALVESLIARLRDLVRRSSTVVSLGNPENAVDDDAEDAFLLAFQDEVAGSATAAEVVSELVAEVLERFRSVRSGLCYTDDDGWPEVWIHESEDRAQFLSDVSVFYSNSAVNFGRLLTPVVNGIRISGPFIPTWADSPLRLVLIDSEGLGHTPASISSLSTSLVKKVAECDSVLVVDNAQQPMLAGPLAALMQIVETGNVAKLHLLFTHLDGVTGDNLAGYAARIAHVRESVDNAIRSIETSTSPSAARALARRSAHALYFAGRVDRLMNGDSTFARKGSEEFQRLARALEGAEEVRDHGDARVVVARRGVALAVRAAAQRFQDSWLVRIGVERPAPASVDRPEHWSRVKALTRRIANDMDDSYLDLKPVADFRRELQSVLYAMIQDPVRWQGNAVEGQEKQEVLDALANAISSHVMNLAERRVVIDRHGAWTDAYGLSGKGSTGLRARLLADEVVRRCAPVPAASMSSEAAELISEVENILDIVAADNHLVLE